MSQVDPDNGSEVVELSCQVLGCSESVSRSIGNLAKTAQLFCLNGHQIYFTVDTRDGKYRLSTPATDDGEILSIES
jgi:hypothetical protein